MEIKTDIIDNLPEESFFINDYFDKRINRITGLPRDMPKKVYLANSNIREALYLYSLGLFVNDSYGKLADWCALPHDTSGNMMLRQIMEANMLCRDFLFNLRTCLDYMEKYIKDLKEDGAQLLDIFTTETNYAYDNCMEYGFAFHLRNCVQHCGDIVHMVDSETVSKIIASKKELEARYDGWKQYDRQYFQQCGDRINLTEVFEKAYVAFEKALVPVVQCAIDKGSVAEELFYLRDWGDLLKDHYKRDVQDFQLMVSTTKDGAPVDMDKEVPLDTEFSCFLINWDLIYKLTDRIQRGKIGSN